jgi:hypothetical protein
LLSEINIGQNNGYAFNSAGDRGWMMNSDLIFSLGPNCRNTWNLRAYFGTDHAFPFDWWITPARSMLGMLNRSFVFEVTLDDLHVTVPKNGAGQNTVYNRKLNILHHHDFDRVGEIVDKITVSQIKHINEKYAYIFSRFWRQVDGAKHPVAVLNGIHNGWATPDGGQRSDILSTSIAPQGLIDGVRDNLGEKTYVVIISVGGALQNDLHGGTMISLPDRGIREDIPSGQVYAEPIHVFREAYRILDLQLNVPQVAES